MKKIFTFFFAVAVVTLLEGATSVSGLGEAKRAGCRRRFHGMRVWYRKTKGASI